MWNLVYDASLTCTSGAFGAGAYVKKQTLWPFVVYAAVASITFRTNRCFTGQAGVHTPSNPLYLHDLACASIALGATLCYNRNPRVQTWIRRAIALFLASHILTSVRMDVESKVVHTVAHACVVRSAWS